ncbi:olfactory receptor 52K1-like [Poecilia latipinna]|uniref:olfactory receptor 52K1 n=1 Tax=Poecilia mexicana TaxID=48701 RepID=UPI00072E9F77|nr:PREDICTED: olfactory receptor 52K1 [Poecilia mexicana]XP_014876657.1 PREDICTED: olfactory receptor 52K1-like [Poecilia latipinna]
MSALLRSHRESPEFALLSSRILIPGAEEEGPGSCSRGGRLSFSIMEEVFTLSGFNDTLGYRAVVFSLASLCYFAILFFNVAIIIVIVSDECLHEPMYILLCVHCVNGLYGTAGFYPKFLADLLSSSQVISYHGCLVQAFVLYSFVCSDTSILTALAYDRYLAICLPLQYHSIMTNRRVYSLVCLSWLTPFCIFSVNIVLTARLRFCGTNIQRLFCLNWVIVKLACPGSNTVINNVYALATLSIYVAHWLFVVWTYIYIVKTCVQSKEDRAKFMQTCVPHLISLVTLFVIVVSDLMHMRFTSYDLPLSFQNFSSLAVVFIPPLMNPLLYGFKLTRIRKRIFVLLFLRKKLPVSS